MKCLLCFLLLLSFNNLRSQDLSWVDQKVINIPSSKITSTEDLARYIQLNFPGDTEKIRAIYAWVAHNIDYDKDSVLHFNTERDPSLKITQAMRRRKGVCENFAAIFCDLANKCNIKAVMIPGYTMQGGMINKASHTWCAATIDKEWYLFDPTWDEDFIKEADYFKSAPWEFINTHMPFDPLWQLLAEPLTHKEFASGSGKFRRTVQNYDSVNKYLQQNVLGQYESTARRMKAAGEMNELTDHHFRFVQMQIGIIYENENMNLYNTAVADLNKANLIFNEFIRYRNSGFTPQKTDEDLIKMLEPVSVLVHTALKNIDKIGVAYPDYQYNPDVIRNRLTNLQRRLEDQQKFVQKFIATPQKDRYILFYQAP